MNEQKKVDYQNVVAVVVGDVVFPYERQGSLTQERRSNGFVVGRRRA